MTDNPRIAGWIYKENENSQSQVTAEILKFLTDEEGKKIHQIDKLAKKY